jgi:hypothetical protein
MKETKEDLEIKLSLRQIYVAIGFLGLIISPLIFIISGNLLSSISYSYYYSEATRNIFVSFLFSIGLFFGVVKCYSTLSNIIHKIMSICAILVAFNPCESKDNFLYRFDWMMNKIGFSFNIYIPKYEIHYIFAFILFSLLGYVCINEFRKSKGYKTPMKKTRNSIYLFCGITIWISVLIIALFSYKGWHIYIAESTDIIPFSIAFLIKGEGFDFLND